MTVEQEEKPKKSVEAQNFIQASQLALDPQNLALTKHARRVYAGNLPVNMGLNEAILKSFFETTLPTVGIKSEFPVVSIWLSPEGGTFCFVELRSVRDCTQAIEALQGISLGGRELKIGRPSEYEPIPDYLADFEIPVSHAMTLRTTPIDSIGLLGTIPLVAVAPTRVLCLSDILTENDFEDDEEYEDICLDFFDECSLFGKVLKVVLPRNSQDRGYKKAYIEFESADSCKIAKSKLNGRKFNGIPALASYFDEAKFLREEL
jgi:hypothetical protein